jgi:hypothetical protein
MLILLSGCDARSEDRDQATDAVTEFLGAVDAGEGERACARLARATVQTLEDEEGKPCAEAVTTLDLTRSDPVKTDVYLTSAEVHLKDGANAFLDETAAGWRVSAAGCRPEPGEEAPQSCEVED